MHLRVEVSFNFAHALGRSQQRRKEANLTRGRCESQSRFRYQSKANSKWKRHDRILNLRQNFILNSLRLALYLQRSHIGFAS